MALPAGPIAGRGDVYAPSMLGMALRASELFSSHDAHGMVTGPIVAAQASAVGSFRGKCPSAFHVTRGAFLFKNRMRLGQAPAAINARIFENGSFRNPDKR